MILHFFNILVFMVVAGMVITGLSDVSIAKSKTPPPKKEFFKLTSPAFKAGTTIPVKYPCDGENVLPPLHLSGVPESAKSLAIVVEDPDVKRKLFTHLISWNIDPKTQHIEENNLPEGTIVASNVLGKTASGGPCPPAGQHRYFFSAYAWDTAINMPEKSKRKDVEKLMKGHIIGQSTLMGTYERPKTAQPQAKTDTQTR